MKKEVFSIGDKVWAVIKGGQVVTATILDKKQGLFKPKYLVMYHTIHHAEAPFIGLFGERYPGYPEYKTNDSEWVKTVRFIKEKKV